MQVTSQCSPGGDSFRECKIVTILGVFENGTGPEGAAVDDGRGRLNFRRSS
jgi:hypothetical protein